MMAGELSDQCFRSLLKTFLDKNGIFGCTKGVFQSDLAEGLCHSLFKYWEDPVKM